MNPGLPPGERIAAMQISLARLFEFSPDFTGYVKAEVANGGGFLLVEKGKPIAGGFIAGDLKLSGRDAYKIMLKENTVNCILSAYTPEELELAKTEIMDDFGIPEEEEEEKEVIGDSVLSPETLQSVMRQPGVRGVSVFFEGFALQSVGDADFEHVAAVAEDLVRAGSKITEDLMMGDLNQLLLETPEGKLIVTPVNELFICVLADTNANLGLIRLALQTIKYDLSEGQKTEEPEE